MGDSETPQSLNNRTQLSHLHEDDCAASLLMVIYSVAVPELTVEHCLGGTVTHSSAHVLYGLMLPSPSLLLSLCARPSWAAFLLHSRSLGCSLCIGDPQSRGGVSTKCQGYCGCQLDEV